MSTDNQHRGGGFETYAAFDTDNCVAHMHVTADTVSGADLFYLLDCFDRVIEFLIVDSFQFSFFESQAELFAAFLFYVFQVSCFGQPLCGVEDFTTTNRGTPQTYVI